MATKEDQEHLKCLKVEHEFLVGLQTRLQKQLKDLKVEEAALLRLISMVPLGNSAPTASHTATDQSTHQFPGPGNTVFTHAGYSDKISDDIVVNQAPLDLQHLTVEKVDTQSFPVPDIDPLCTQNFQTDNLTSRLSSSNEEEDDDSDANC